MNKKNRLKLDFTLQTNEQRSEFANKYLNQEQFQKHPPTEEELETIANYILWGKDPQTGLNSKQSKDIQLESRNKTWDCVQDESLDALLETPGFSEHIIRASTEPALKQTKKTFSRQEAREEAPAYLLPRFEELWKEIDELDLLINFYDLAHNKRKLEPRPELINKFSPKEIEQIKEKAKHLNQYSYLKRRHLLVELRREQFTLRDSYKTQRVIKEGSITEQAIPPIFDADINILPVGLKYLKNSKLFPEDRFPYCEDFQEKELEVVIKDYWHRRSLKGQSFDFREANHVYNAFNLLEILEYDAEQNEVYSTLNQFLDTLDFYIARAKLTDVQREILALKLRRVQNLEITQIINPKYNKTYNPNYISTIFKQRIIPAINEAARIHEEIIQNLPYPENFKRCRECGEMLFISTDNFMRKARSNDGFSTQCKRCDKKKRDARRINK